MFGIFGGEDETPDLENMSARDLKLEADNVRTEMKVEEKKLKQLDSKFKQKIQEAAEVSGPERNRLKSEAASIKRNYEQKQDAYQANLKEYTTLKTLQNAKNRVDNNNGSVLRDMDREEMETFRQETMDQINREVDHVERIGEIGDTINETLTAISSVGDTEVDNEIDELIEAAEQGDELSDFSLAEETESESTSESSLNLDDI